MLEDLDLSAIGDERVRQGFVLLLNLVEELKRENRELRAENQRLRDEIARLKGEQGKPKIKANTPKPPPSTPSNYSSEKQRRTPKEWKKGKKLDQIRIDREQTLELDRTTLPEDAEFKGHEDVVVQDVVFGTDNILFHKEKYYSPGQGETYLAALPVGYEGQFGPSLRALSVALYFGANVSEPKLVELYRQVGVVISEGQVSNLLIKAQEPFHAEKAAVFEAGLASSPWQHLDDTSTRVNGQNRYCQVVCNQLYTSYQTTESKDRQTILDVLRNGRAREYLLNAEAESLLAGVLSGVAQKQMAKLPRDERLDEPTMLRLLEERLPKLGVQQRKWVLDATAVAAYHAQVGYPVVKLLVCDDAPQFTWLTEDLASASGGLGPRGQALQQARTLLSAFPEALGGVHDRVLGLLRRAPGLPRAPELVRAGAALGQIRRALLDRARAQDRLLRLERADRQDPGEEGGTPDGARASGDPAAQQPGGVGGPSASAQARRELRAAGARRDPSLGYLPDAGGHSDEAGSELLCLRPRPHLQAQQAARACHPDHRPSRRSQPRGFLG